MNICHFLGRLTRDPELEDANGTSLLRFTIAVSRKYKTQGGEKKEDTSFLDFVAWDKGAEAISKFFKKGDNIIVHASAKQEVWEKDGQKRSKIVFRCENFEFPPGNRSKDDDGGGSNENQGNSSRGNGGGSTKPPSSEEDIPF